MPFQKGNQLAKGKKIGGRKKLTEELAIALDDAKKKITQEALIELANNKVYKFLNEADSHAKVKDLGLPISLKGITEKKEISGNSDKPIAVLNFNSIEDVNNYIADKLK